MPDALIDAAWQSGQATWPGVQLTRERYAAHVANLEVQSVERFGSDLYLAAACLAGEPAAHATFDRVLLPSARKPIAAIDARGAFVDEAVQRLRASLFVAGESGAPPRIASYAGRGPLHAWVGIAGARQALMMRRSQQRAREVSSDEDEWTGAIADISTANPELELLKRQYADAFKAALRDATGTLEPRLRAVLRMSFVDALSIDEIGTVYAVHRATAARWIQRACDELHEQTRALLVERLALSDVELDQMTALVRSQLDVSLSQLLPGTVA